MTDRTELWLPLLRRLTEVVPSWLLWKNAELAFTGIGDIDAAAPEADWPTIEREFRAWAEAAGAGPVVVCRHIPGGLNLIAVPPGESTFLEMGVKARRIWRGSTLFVLADILPMAVTDPRGFRRLRPGAEGLFKLLLNGTRQGGSQDAAAMEAKGVRDLLRTDPAGVVEGARLFGFARVAASRAARAAAAGGWSRPALLALEGRAILLAVTNPKVTIARLRFRRNARATCPVVEAILGQGRRIPDDRTGWIERLGRDHPVHAGSGSGEGRLAG